MGAKKAFLRSKKVKNGKKIYLHEKIRKVIIQNVKGYVFGVREFIFDIRFEI